MSEDSTFDHMPTPEEVAAAEADAELARRIRAEVVRITSGEADDDLAEDERQRQEQDEQERQEQEAKAAREERAKENLLFALVSGNILLYKGVSRYYSHMLLIVLLTAISIFVMFWSLRVDMKHTALVNEVQLLRERSVRMRESRYEQSSHSAVVRELNKRGIDLKDARTPSVVIDN